MTTSPRRRRIVLLSLAVVLVLVAAGVTYVLLRPGAEPAAGPASTAVVGPDGVRLSVDGVLVEGPAGVAPVGTVLTGRRIADGPTGRATTLAASVGPGVRLDLGGLQPQQPLTLTFPIAADVGATPTGVLLTAPSDDPDTRLVPGSYLPAQRAVRAEVRHLSTFWPGFLDFSRLAGVVTGFLGQTTGISAAKPDCVGKPGNTKDTTLALAGDLTGDAPPAWPCARAENGGVTVELTSNSPLPWRVRAAPSATLQPPGSYDLSKAAILAAYRTLVTNRPYAEGLLVPGTSVSYRFPASATRITVAGQADPGTYLGMALLFGISEALTVFGVDTRGLTEKAETLSCLGDAVESAKLGLRPSVDAMAALARATLSCAARFFGDAVGIVAGVIGSGLGLVVAGLQGAVLTLLGRDSFSLTVSVRGTGPATKALTVAGVTAGGTPAPGWTVQDEGAADADADCYDASPAARGRDIVTCYPTALGADVCWPAADRLSMVCGDKPWDKSLLRYTLTKPIPVFGAAPDPQPWGLQLADGAKCRLRNGGSWDSRADDYVGAYYCDRDGEYVLAKQGGTVVTKSAPMWTVLVGELGRPDQSFPAPKPVGVVTAWFAGSP